MNLPSADEQSRNKVREWEVPKSSSDNDDEHLNEDRDEDERRKR